MSGWKEVTIEVFLLLSTLSTRTSSDANDVRFNFCNFESIVRQYDQQKNNRRQIYHTCVWIGGITF